MPHVRKALSTLAILKSDALGTVELLKDSEGRRWLGRFATGGQVPGSAAVARLLLGREQRALAHAAGLAGLPAVPDDAPELARALAAERGVRAGAVGLRAYLEGAALHRAERLPQDFFELLTDLVGALHARGVCHNDLHKEQNIVVLPDGRPGLIDFQLASIHARRGRGFGRRTSDDLRHIEKHRLRYQRQGRPKRPEERSSVALPRRSPLAALWRRTGKPLYNHVTRRWLKRSDGEERRPSSGPWPEWTEPLG